MSVVKAQTSLAAGDFEDTVDIEKLKKISARLPAKRRSQGGITRESIIKSEDL